jgi:hypothetical protein
MIRGTRRGRPPALLSAVLAALLASSASQVAARPLEECALPLSDRLPEAVAQAQRSVEAVRGIAFRAPVQSALLSESELGAVLGRKLVEDLPVSFDAYAASLVSIGLIEASPDLMKRLTNLYTRQVVGFYDPEEKKFYVVTQRTRPAETTEQGADAEAGPLLEESLLAHELTHALQDQRLDLDRRMKGLKESTDALLALEAMLEGEATVVMAEVLMTRIPAESRDLLGRDVLSDMIATLAQAGTNAVDGAEGVPEFFVKELLFPYTAGTTWIRARRAGGGWGPIDESYRRPPASTSEILHPDRKPATRTRLAPADRPSSRSVPRGGQTLYSDTLGEWTLGLLLERAGAGDDAAPLAAGWQDDRVVFFDLPGSPGGAPGFLWRIRCASPADAARIGAALRPLYSGRPSSSRPAVSTRRDVVEVAFGVSGRRGPSAPAGERRTAGSR